MKDLVPLCGGWSPRVLPAALTHRPPRPDSRFSQCPAWAFSHNSECPGISSELARPTAPGVEAPIQLRAKCSLAKVHPKENGD